MVSSIESFHCIQDNQLGPDGVLYREVPLYMHAFLFLRATNSSLRLVAPQVKQGTLIPKWHTHTYSYMVEHTLKSEEVLKISFSVSTP